MKKTTAWFKKKQHAKLNYAEQIRQSVNVIWANPVELPEVYL